MSGGKIQAMQGLGGGRHPKMGMITRQCWTWLVSVRLGSMQHREIRDHYDSPPWPTRPTVVKTFH